MTEDTNDPKGWPHPEGRQRRRKTVEGSPFNQAREEESRVKEQHRPVRRSDSRADQHKPKPTASAWGSRTALDERKPNQRRESHVTVVDWGRTPTGPEIGDPTGRVGTPPDPGVQRHSSTMRASQQVPDKEPSQHPPQRSYGGRTTKDKPQPPQATSQPGSEREEPKEGSRKQQVPGPTNGQSTRSTNPRPWRTTKGSWDRLRSPQTPETPHARSTLTLR